MTATTNEEESTIGSITIMTSPWIIIVKEMTEDTRNCGSTQIRIDGTRNAKGTGTSAATTVRESITEKNVGNRPESTNGSQIQE